MKKPARSATRQRPEAGRSRVCQVCQDLAAVNRLVLSATLVGRAAIRYTPAGLPALDLSLMHESEVSEDGQPRKVSMEMKAVAIGAVTRVLTPLAMGSAGLYGGFVTSARNGRGLLFHITSVDPQGQPETSGLI